MDNKRITDLTKVSIASDTDLLIIETSNGTRSIEMQNISQNNSIPDGVVIDEHYVHSDNNYTNTDKDKVNLVKKDGDGIKFLSDDGIYKVIENEYELPKATNAVLGGVVIGDNLEIDTSDKLKVSLMTSLEVDTIIDSIFDGN